jgi:integrase
MLAEHISQPEVVRSGLVFPSAQGEVLRHSNFRNRIWRPAVASSGVPQTLRFHDLRHTAVALAIAQGAHPKAIQERMGHSSVTVTLDRYGHLFPTLHSALADKLDELMRHESGIDLALVPAEGSEDSPELRVSSGASKNRTCDLILIRDAL